MSKPMTKTQIEHLSNRIDQAINEAADKFKKTLPEAKYLTKKQEGAEAKAGNFRIKLDEDGELPYRTTSALIFEKNVKAEALAAANNKAIEKFVAPLRAKKQSIMDSAVLGGADEALAALNKFIADLAKK